MNLADFLRALGQASLAATVLIMLVLVAQRIFRRVLTPKWHCALWLLVALRLLLPFSLSSEVSLFNLFPTRASAIAPATSGIDFTSANSAASSAQSQIALQPPVTQTPDTARSFVVWWEDNFVVVLFWIWLVGTLAVAIAIARSAIAFARAIADAKPVIDKNALSLLRDCAAALGVRHVPRLLTTRAVNTPALHGLIRPRVLLPDTFVEAFSREEQRFVYLHELAHLRRRDLWSSWAMAAIQAVHWFNPLVWFAFSRWRADREIACDAVVLEAIGASHARAYGQTMLRLLELFRVPVRAPGFVGILENNRQLHRRLTQIVRFKRARRPFAVAVFAIIALVGMTDAQVAGSLTPPAAATSDTAAREIDQALVDEITTRFNGDRRKFLDHLRERGLTQREYRRQVAANLEAKAAVPRPTGPYVLYILNASETMLDEYTPVSPGPAADNPERGQVYVPRGSTMTDDQKRNAPKWLRALQSLDNMLRTLPAGTSYYVAVLADSAIKPIGSRADAANLGAIDTTMSRLSALLPRGRANLEAAFGFVAEDLPSPAPERIVLITDGLPTTSDASPHSGDITESERINAFHAASRRMPAKIPVHTMLISAPTADPAAAGLFWQLAHATRGQLTIPAKVASDPRTHLAFVVDTSGSMRDPNGGGLWPVVIRTIEATLDTQPQLAGLQVLDGDGRFLLGRRGTGARAWLPNTPEVRAQLGRYVRRYDQDSISDPVPGIANALRFLHDANSDMRMGIYVLGDEFISRGNVASVLERIESLNPRGADGRRPTTISAIGFPTTVRSSFSMGNTGLRFANLMRILAESHDGSFIALPEL